MDLRWILGPILISFVTSLFIPCNLRDNHLPRLPGEKFRFRMLGLPLMRFVQGKLQVLSKADEDVEWEKYMASVTLKQSVAESVDLNDMKHWPQPDDQPDADKKL